ncbi:MAG: hypothetical protein Q9187_008467, partial [Circinaria calcarea]
GEKEAEPQRRGGSCGDEGNGRRNVERKAMGIFVTSQPEKEERSHLVVIKRQWTKAKSFFKHCPGQKDQFTDSARLPFGFSFLNAQLFDRVGAQKAAGGMEDEKDLLAVLDERCNDGSDSSDVVVHGGVVGRRFAGTGERGGDGLVAVLGEIGGDLGERGGTFPEARDDNDTWFAHVYCFLFCFLFFFLVEGTLLHGESVGLGRTWFALPTKSNPKADAGSPPSLWINGQHGKVSTESH